MADSLVCALATVCRHKSLATAMFANTCSKNGFRPRNRAMEDEACAAPAGSLYASPNVAVIEHIQPGIRTNIAIYSSVRSLDHADFLCQIGEAIGAYEQACREIRPATAQGS